MEFFFQMNKLLTVCVVFVLKSNAKSKSNFEVLLNKFGQVIECTENFSYTSSYEE